MSVVTYRYRVKCLNGYLNAQARAVNYVWNFCNDTQKHALKWGKLWPSGFDLSNLTSGSCVELKLGSGTVQSVCEQYAASRAKSKKLWLRYRGKKSLGWVPFKGLDVVFKGDSVKFRKKLFRVFLSQPFPTGKILSRSSFSQDARGNWFLNLVTEVIDAAPRNPKCAVGIDLGLTTLATFSTGEKIENPRWMRGLAEKLAVNQRARKKRQVRNVHAAVRNARKDHQHKLSRRIVNQFDYVAVGDVRVRGLTKTTMAKSVRDASWSLLRSMLAYKAVRHGAHYEEVNEIWTTQTCSSCGSRPHSRPQGNAGLEIRQWVCSDCGVDHDRDVNAAKNILARSGYRAPVEGVVRKLTEVPSESYSSVSSIQPTERQP